MVGKCWAATPCLPSFILIKPRGTRLALSCGHFSLWSAKRAGVTDHCSGCKLVGAFWTRLTNVCPAFTIYQRNGVHARKTSTTGGGLCATGSEVSQRLRVAPKPLATNRQIISLTMLHKIENLGMFWPTLSLQLFLSNRNLIEEAIAHFAPSWLRNPVKPACRVVFQPIASNDMSRGKTACICPCTLNQFFYLGTEGPGNAGWTCSIICQLWFQPSQAVLTNCH